MRYIRFPGTRPRISLLSALLLLLPSLLFSQVELRNPGFPGWEKITYLQSTEKNTEIVEMNLRFISSAERPYYEYSMKSETQDLLIRLDPDTLCVFYSEVWEKQEDSTIHRITEISKNERPAGPDQLIVTGPYGFEQSLRGFPWSNRDSAMIAFLSGPDSFQFELKVKGVETLNLNGSSYECRRVQIGLNGLLGAIFPKSHYWYSVNPPYYLVRSESSGMQGRDKTVLEIISYTSGQ